VPLAPVERVPTWSGVGEPHRFGFVGDDGSEERDKGRRPVRHGDRGHTDYSGFEMW
jgi:hypothetical protein